MRKTIISGIAVLACLGLLGCDSDSLDEFLSEGRELSIETTLLPLGSCRTIVSELSLFADDDLIGTAKIDVGGEAIFKSVRIPPGQFEVDLRVEVTSNNGMVIFEGFLQPSVVSDEFEFELVPTAVAPVMEICIPNDEQSFEIKNRGNPTRAVQWSIVATRGPACLADTPSCLVLTPSSGSVTVDSTVVTYRVNTATADTVDLLIESVEGSIGIRVVPSSLAAGKHHVVTFRSHTSTAQ